MNAKSNLKLSPQPVVLSHEVFRERSMYVQGIRLYYSYFGVVPSVISLSRINYQKSLKWILNCLKGNVISRHSLEGNSRRNRKIVKMTDIFLLDNGIMLEMDRDDNFEIYFQDEMREEAERIYSSVKKFTRRTRMTRNISFIIDEGHGLRCVELPNKKPELDINLHYNEDMASVHKVLIDKLGNNDNKGLVLLHGKPGTGKSTYLRYLINHLKKRIIFMPSRLAASMDAPSMMTFMLDYRNSIIIIEDAEDLIRSRENGPATGISTLLNLTDGVLGESLCMQVICTFNTKLANIDSALLRKGRLIQAYEFGALTLENTRRLLSKLGENPEEANVGMTLAEIYHLHETNQVNINISQPTIGFQLKAAG